MNSIAIPTIKPNRKYTGGDRLCPDVLEVRLCSASVLAFVVCTGQLIVAVDDSKVDGCVVGQGCVSEIQHI